MHLFFRRARASLVRRVGRMLRGGNCLCVVCGQKLSYFLPFAGGVEPVPGVLKELDVVGSDLERCACPKCESNDRERHLLLYCQRSGIDRFIRGAHVLHFAPERSIAAYMAGLALGRYVKADLYPAAADVQRVDMLHMEFPDASFDLVIANHVLEHVDDDVRALSEIRRVLRPGGKAILQTPYSAMLLASFEDKGVQSRDARTFAYGQDDHVRLYGRDVFDRFCAAGFISRVVSHQEAMPDIAPTLYGVNPREPFFLFERN
jgi:SAM-dependent methyltransferase